MGLLAARAPRPDDHPVIATLLTRAQRDGTPGAHEDGHTLALAIEGGGMRGAVSGGMCVMLEALDLVRCVDVIYGCSSGALNGSYTAAGQAAMGAANYEDTIHRRLADLRRIIGPRPVLDLDALFDEVIVSHRPYDAQALRRGPDFRAVAVSPEDGEIRVLRDFASRDELARAVRASCAMPVFAGEPVRFRDEPLVDGALRSSVPFAPALQDGATHVLALRSRAADYRMHAHRRVVVEALRRRFAEPMASLLVDRPDRYNAEAEALAAASAGAGTDGDRLVELCPAADVPHIGSFERSVPALRAGLDAGAQATARLLADGPVTVHWEPRVRPSAAPRPARPPRSGASGRAAR